MSNYINLPTIQAQHVQPQPPVDQSTQTESSTPLQVMPPFLETGASEAQVGTRVDQGIVDPQSLIQVLEHTLSQTLLCPHAPDRNPLSKRNEVIRLELGVILQLYLH